MKNKRILKIIKYNKRLYKKLDLGRNDFKVYEILQEFNKKYNKNIEDIDVKELNLQNRKLGDEGLKF